MAEFDFGLSNQTKVQEYQSIAVINDEIVLLNTMLNSIVNNDISNISFIKIKNSIKSKLLNLETQKELLIFNNNNNNNNNTTTTR